jgi:hypothetical protein
MPGGALERGRRQRRKVDPVQVSRDEQRARTAEPGCVERRHVVDRHRRHRSGIAVQWPAVPHVGPEQVGPQRRVRPRPGRRPEHLERGDLVVAYPLDVGRVETRPADRLGHQRHRGGQPLHRHLHRAVERVPIGHDGQIGAQRLQRDGVRGGVPFPRALLQPLGHDAGQPFAAQRLATGAGVEQQRGDGQVVPRQIRRDDLAAGGVQPHDGREPVGARGTRSRAFGDERHAAASSGS